MTTTVPGVITAGLSLVHIRHTSLVTGGFRPQRTVRVYASATTRRPVVSTEQQPPTNVSINGRFVNSSKAETNTEHKAESESDSESHRLGLKDYFEQSKELVRSSDGGPPRWFTPLDCGSRLENSPLLLFLPGIDGVGLGLILQHQRLGEIFDVWCLHIPVTDQTPFTGLVKLVEKTVRSENRRSPKRPIYLVGESTGGCLALAVAANNPNIDLVLVLANPATCFSKSQLHPLLPLLEVMPEQLRISMPYMLSLMTGIPSSMVMTTVEKGLPVQQTLGEILENVIALTSYVSVLTDSLSVEMLLWKLKMLKSASAYANSRLHAIRAQTLLLSSGRDQLLPSQDEGERLCKMLPNCEIRKFNESGHALFLVGCSLSLYIYICVCVCVCICLGAIFMKLMRLLMCQLNIDRD
ncbi:unnamed protein product [Ilex paraguariensis]|uniref:Serine aminopeptidase S33 domain-containing protein n=1 Tax=Ilex paraguariensis TaxID=185542 RepID=A0ABC8U0G9_9AQUA